MTSKLTEVLIDCADTESQAAFWCDVLGWKVVDGDGGSIEIGDGEDGVTIVLQPVPEPKTIKNRIHLDVVAVGGDQDAEVQRVIALGATRVDIGQGDVTWVVLADPEGNEFCILRGTA
jgi:catechol 2,3-dioxygenase-like lactoylglutathione lyase family enzyme